MLLLGFRRRKTRRQDLKSEVARPFKTALNLAERIRAHERAQAHYKASADGNAMRTGGGAKLDKMGVNAMSRQDRQHRGSDG